MRGRGVNATGRSKAEPFVRLPIWMLKSAAWRTLSPSAFKLLVHLWSRHNGQNNGEIAYAVRDAAEIGLGKSAASDALAELVDRGFLKIRRAATFKLKTKEARTWELTAEPVNGQPASRDFMRWVHSDGRPKRSEIRRKNRTQSGVPDTQSGVPDREAPNLRIEGLSVRCAGPSTLKSTLPQSGTPDTSNIPGCVEPAAVRGDGVGPRQPEPATRTDAAEPTHIGGRVDQVIDRLDRLSSSSADPSSPGKQYCYPPARDCERIATTPMRPEKMGQREFAHWLRTERTAAGITLEELSNVTPYDSASLADFEDGGSNPGRVGQRAIVAALRGLMGEQAA